MARRDVAGILFDKDGVLFDFQGTWGRWVVDIIAHFAAGDGALATRLADALEVDLTTGLVRRGSFMIAGTADEVADAFTSVLSHRDPGDVINVLEETAERVPLVPAVALRPTFTDLQARGLKIGLATNDLEAAARTHLSTAGVLDCFDFIAGADSGHGAKPAPGMCNAFASAVALPSERLVMVGDATHDMHAGRAAGFTCVAVLTGVAHAEDLAPHADAVLPDIAALSDWLDRPAEA